jgi:c(7)-type cytochrome triheme protein
MKRLVSVFCAVSVLALLGAHASAAEGGSRKRRALPNEYGRVVIANHSEANRLAPVVFNHWLHRAKYTCRLCHVDVGFAMKAGGSDIRARDNAAGQFCGACHDGKHQSPDGKTIFESCAKATPSDTTTCNRCHSLGRNVRFDYDFQTFTRGFPRERFGNGINWEKAEAEKVIQPADFVEGVSFERKRLPVVKDFSLASKMDGMPNTIFSHAKHTVWNGCEVCHPAIFAMKASATKNNTMVAMFEGLSCGVCHTNVAFPLIDCQRCHTEPVQ